MNRVSIAGPAGVGTTQPRLLLYEKEPKGKFSEGKPPLSLERNVGWVLPNIVRADT